MSLLHQAGWAIWLELDSQHELTPASKKAVEQICNTRGLSMNQFIEDALIDKLGELENIEDLTKIRGEPARPLLEVLKDLKV
ncbi:MAG: hypothetical protein ACREVN_07185 [Gammaproteobacteria bacterium]